MSDINLIWFQTTAGHYGRNDLYKNTFNNLKRHISLNNFTNKYLSLKVFNEDSYEEIVETFLDFKKYLWLNKDPRINNESPFKDYSYYLLNNYLADICNFYLSIESDSYSEYSYLVEDDSPIIMHKNNLAWFFETAINELKKDPNLFSVRFKRELEFEENINLSQYSDDLFIERATNNNFQNQVFRTSDMIKVAKMISNNYEKLRNIHTETAVKLGIEAVNKDFNFLVLNPKIGYSIHIGTPDAQKWIDSYRL